MKNMCTYLIESSKKEFKEKKRYISEYVGKDCLPALQLKNKNGHPVVPVLEEMLEKDLQLKALELENANELVRKIETLEKIRTIACLGKLQSVRTPFHKNKWPQINGINEKVIPIFYVQTFTNNLKAKFCVFMIYILFLCSCYE